MSEEKQAQRLARWVDEALAGRGTPTEAPVDLDDDVREAIAAIRPDRAPAARVTADDLLQVLTAGPLAKPGSAQTGGQVVAFPGAAPATSRARRGWRALGGAGGIGLLLAAAGVLFVFGLDGEVLQSAPTPEASAPPASAATAPPTVATTSDSELSRDAMGKGEEWDPNQSKERKPQAADESKVAARSPVEEAGVDRDASLPIAAEGRSTGAGIPEAERTGRALPPAEMVGAVSDAAPDPALAELEYYKQESAPAAQAEQQQTARNEPPPKDLKKREQRYDNVFTEPADDAQPAAAAPPPVLQSVVFGWASGLDAETQGRFDTARARGQALASTGRYAEAAATLSAVVTAPARAGMYHAGLAVDYWLQAGDPDAAVAIAQQGLSLGSEDSPERTALFAKLGAAEAAQRRPTEMYRSVDDER